MSTHVRFSISLISVMSCRKDLDILHLLTLVLVISTSLRQIKIKLESKEETLEFMFHNEFLFHI